MLVTCVHVRVKPDKLDSFIEATVKNHLESVREPGNLRFDVLRSVDDPARFMLYEAYESEAAAKAHKETAHYLEWRSTVEEWMAEPRQGSPYSVVFPEDRGSW